MALLLASDVPDELVIAPLEVEPAVDDAPDAPVEAPVVDELLGPVCPVVDEDVVTGCTPPVPPDPVAPAVLELPLAPLEGFGTTDV